MMRNRLSFVTELLSHRPDVRPPALTARWLQLEPLEQRLALTTLPTGFAETIITTGLTGPTAMEISPDGRMWALEQAGNVKLVNSNGTTFTALTKTVSSSGERGMLGIAFDPNFNSNKFVYLYYTNPNAGTASWATGIHNQLSRFTVDDSIAGQPKLVNEAPILDFNTLSSATNHNGGAIHFGTDGMLYANLGDNVQSFTGPDGKSYRVSQSLATMLGKQLRIDVSKFNSGVATRNDTTVGHLIPSDNPFVGSASGINQLIYTLGLRNPYTFAVQPGTGRIFVNDVGETTWEEVNESFAGGNYGWSGGNTDGFNNPPPAFAAGTYHDPLLAYGHSSGSLATGSAIVGGTFYNPTTVQFPSSYVGMYFYADLSSKFIRYFNPNDPNSAASPDGNSTAFATNTPSGMRDLKVDAAGNMYFMAGGDGSIRKISVTLTTDVVGRQLFYNNSSYDGNDAAINAADDGSIATNKTAYLPGSGAATFSSVSSYSRGINGVMIDLSGSHAATLTASDFIFRVGNNNSSSTWTTAPAPTSISIRTGQGTGGSDRVEIVWPDGAIQKTWLQVIVKAGANTGLAQRAGSPAGQGDVFFFANAMGDSGSDDSLGFVTNTNDELGARNNPAPLAANIPTSNPYDYNRDGKVDAADQLIARNNGNAVATAPKILNIESPPAAPEVLPLVTTASADDEGVANALALAGSGSAAAGDSETAAWLPDELETEVRALAGGSWLNTATATLARGSRRVTDGVLDGLFARDDGDEDDWLCDLE